MNIKKLFELQKQLDLRIEREHPRKPGEDRLAKKILALQVELGELANCWRGFKYWSNDQEPRRIDPYCVECAGTGEVRSLGIVRECKCNPLLEEYVDCLHFILSIGLEIDFKRKPIDIIKSHDVITQFNEMFRLVSAFWRIYAETGVIKGCGLYDTYEDILRTFMGLGQELGFTWEQIEEAYMKKNAENHIRQENGY